MLLRQHVLDGIARGTITLAFRRWHRPSVKSGGTLLTSAGQLGIASVVAITAADISEADARSAGHESRAALLAELGRRDDGLLYRIELGPLTPDPRIALRSTASLDEHEHSLMRERLCRFDARSTSGPWTLRTLELIRSKPGVRAADLCRAIGQDKLAFKADVRKLKAMGLTESLEVGYRLSPRGVAFLRDLERSGEPVEPEPR